MNVFFLENSNANPTFAVKAILNLSNVVVITLHLILKHFCKMFISIVDCITHKPLFVSNTQISLKKTRCTQKMS